jgi:hypothetical protein
MFGECLIQIAGQETRVVTKYRYDVNVCLLQLQIKESGIQVNDFAYAIKYGITKKLYV